MKKQILIVSSSLVTGGLEKCIINLCNNLDYEKYDVDLYLFNEGRDLLPQLNEKVHLLPDSPYYASVYNRPILHGCKELIRQGKLSLCFYRIFRTIRSNIGMNLNTVYDWKQMKQTMLTIDKHYDAAIGFEEGTADYYVAECVNADVRSCWIHTDIKKIDTNRQLDSMAFGKCDYICTVSENSADSLKELYPDFSNKMRVFSLPSLYNTERLFTLAKEDAGFEKEYFNVVSIGRLVELKGFQFCVEACKKLIEKGYKVKWYVAGEGEYRETLEQLIQSFNLEKNFILLGNCNNPYKYIQAADVCVQPSGYEGYGLVVYEEKLLSKPVILSDIPSFREMVSDGINGFIVQRSAEGVYQALKRMLMQPELLEKLGKNPINGYTTKEETMQEIETTLNHVD